MLKKIFKKSKVGTILASVYLVLTATIFIYAMTCSIPGDGGWCSLVAIVPVMPWVFIILFIGENLLSSFLPNSFHWFIILYILFPIAVILNSVILHWIGYWIESLFNSHTS